VETRVRSAFTTLELLLTLAILAITTASAVLVWPRIEGAMRLEASLQQLAADLREARALAVASSRRVRLLLASGAARYVRECADDDGRYQADRTRTLPRGITVAAVNSGGDLVFSARGDAENATVILTDRRGVRRTLVLNQRGRITLGQVTR
jgi:type II secretory pathway pseudopilin PulG